MRYPVAIEPGDDKHAYGVAAPDLPGCFSADGTLARGETRSGFLARAAIEALSRDAA